MIANVKRTPSRISRLIRAALAAAAAFGAILGMWTPPGLAFGGGGHGHGHGHDEEEFERGPHDGRLLEDGDFAIEVVVFETGTDPVFRLYPFRDGQPIDPEPIEVVIELTRLGGAVDRFVLEPEGEWLTSEDIVAEPHSFDVSVRVDVGGKSHAWTYESHEGRVQIPDAIAEKQGIETQVAGPAKLILTRETVGRVAVIPDRYARVEARFPGLIEKVSFTIGDRVSRGDVLAVVESNETLQSYPVKSPVDGVVLARAANLGAMAGDEALFEIADLNEVWVELHLFERDLETVRQGQAVLVESLDGRQRGRGRIDQIFPIAERQSQTSLARVVLANADRAWRVGAMIRGVVETGVKEVPLAVRREALQRFRDFTVVYAKVGETYEVRMLELGAGNGEWVQVLGGLDPGVRYVVKNSFLIKADVEKSGASHDH